MSTSRLTVELACGSRVNFRARTLVPGVDELFPCTRHGCCRVVAHRADAAPTPVGSRRRARRTAPELLEYVRDRRPVPVAELRRHRFTLRLIADVHRKGLVHIEVHADGAPARVSSIDVRVGC